MKAIEVFLIICALIPVISIFWSTLRVGISPMPSSRKACRVIIENIEVSDEREIVDLGSGWGTLVIALAKKYPERRIVGYEISFFPWLVSLLIKHALGLSNLTLYRRDFLKADLSGASILICYLFPGGMESLEAKLQKETKESILVVSNTFALPSYKPEKTIHAGDMHNSPIYFYRIS